LTAITTNIIEIGSRRPLVVERDTVYFIRRQVGRGAVKIGYARNPAARLAELQTGSDARLEIIATLPGGQVVERALHVRFAHLRLRGEWFRYSGDLAAFIRSIPDRYDNGREIGRREARAARFAALPVPADGESDAHSR
jgi:hypothetical protein